MKKKKVLSLVLVIVTLLSSFIMIPSVSAASNPVALVYAKSVVKSAQSLGWAAWMEGYVEVENIAYAKEVTIHYSFDGVTWDDISAKYMQKSHGTKEIWSFTTQSNPFTTIDYHFYKEIKFAIKYKVDGKTYWDNNNGKNYFVAALNDSPFNQYAIGCGGLAVREYSYRLSTFSGNIMVKDLGDSQEVKVRYTTDGWKTYKDLEATRDMSYYGNHQLWRFSDSVTAASPDFKIEFAAYYTVNGTTYWDNNFNKNYTCP